MQLKRYSSCFSFIPYSTPFHLFTSIIDYLLLFEYCSDWSVTFYISRLTILFEFSPIGAFHFLFIVPVTIFMFTVWVNVQVIRIDFNHFIHPNFSSSLRHHRAKSSNFFKYSIVRSSGLYMNSVSMLCCMWNVAVIIRILISSVIVFHQITLNQNISFHYSLF